MGQRLNIEIWNNGKCLTNAYYHWSAYTSKAIMIVSDIMHIVENLSEDISIYDAIKILESTGAGVTKCEEKYIEENRIAHEEFAECKGRDYGLIAISPSGIQETRDWEEGRVSIYIDEKRINFNVLYSIPQYKWDSEYAEDYKTKFSDLPVVDFAFDDIKFKNWIDFSKEIKNLIENDTFCVKETVHGEALIFIE